MSTAVTGDGTAETTGGTVTMAPPARTGGWIIHPACGHVRFLAGPVVTHWADCEECQAPSKVLMAIAA